MKILISLILGMFCLCLSLSCVSHSVKYSLLNREWMMVSFDLIPKDEFIKNKVSIHLNKDESSREAIGKLFTGSNTIVFNFKIKDSNRIEIKNIKNEYVNSNQTELSLRFLEFLKKVKIYKKDGHFLTLYDKDAKSMRLVAADWD